MMAGVFETGILYLTHYLDNFLFLVAPNGSNTLALARGVFADLGIQVAENKTDAPWDLY